MRRLEIPSLIAISVSVLILAGCYTPDIRSASLRAYDPKADEAGCWLPERIAHNFEAFDRLCTQLEAGDPTFTDDDLLAYLLPFVGPDGYGGPWWPGGRKSVQASRQRRAIKAILAHPNWNAVYDPWLKAYAQWMATERTYCGDYDVLAETIGVDVADDPAVTYVYPPASAQTIEVTEWRGVPERLLPPNLRGRKL